MERIVELVQELHSELDINQIESILNTIKVAVAGDPELLEAFLNMNGLA